MNKIKIKIRPTVLILIFILVGFAVLTTLGIQYYFSKRLAYSAVKENVEHISEKVQDRMNTFNKSNFDLIAILEHSSELLNRPTQDQNRSLLKKFTAGMNNNPYIYAIYMGFKDGSFYEVINLDVDVSLRKKFKSSALERWFVVKILNENNQKIRLEQFLDKDFNVLRVVKKAMNYDPTTRPWYKKSLQSKNTIITSAYAFSNLDGLGLTYAKHIKNSGAVMGVDVSLNSISTFLNTQNVHSKTQLYLFDKYHKIIASNMAKADYPNDIQTILKDSINTNNALISLKEEDFLVSNNLLDSKYSNTSYLSIFTSESQILEPFNEKILFSVLINFVLMLTILPLVWISTRLIVNPIHNLQRENDKIKKRQFDKVQQVKTPIKELDDLSESFVSMSGSIQAHEKSQRELMDSFIQLIAKSIDAKSAYTGGHCKRVPILTELIAQKASECNEGIFQDFKIENEDEKHELSVASWLHDCGKVVIPDYVVDKATKLETIYNRIHEIRMRFEVIFRDLIITSYECISQGEDEKEIQEWLEEEQKQLQKDFEFIANVNIGSEYISTDDIERINTIAKKQWIRNFDDSLGLSYDEQKRYEQPTSNKEYLLANKRSHLVERSECFHEENEQYGFKICTPEYLYNLGEIYNLSVSKGTLTHEERFKVNEHMSMTIKMLEELPFPENLKNVPEYAGAHHETLIGTGYPRQLTKEQMSIPARIMAIADVFEALTAADRPYKKAKTLSESIKILSFMVKDQHLDEDIFKLFLSTGVYLEYAKQFLKEEQVDKVDISGYL